MGSRCGDRLEEKREFTPTTQSGGFRLGSKVSSGGERRRGGG